MTSLNEVLQTARSYWEAKGRSSRMMPIRAETCADMLGEGPRGYWEAHELGPVNATFLLGELARHGLSKSTQGSYYAAFRRALALSGISTVNWPKGPVAPRRVREPLEGADVRACQDWLTEKGWSETDYLVAALMVTGLRVEVEALSADAITYGSDTITVIGKGGHERTIPVRSAGAVKRCLGIAQRVPYATHLDRWTKAVNAVGVSTKLPTFHAIRHLYATQAYHKSGKNLRVVQELLGHADISTTARYIGVDMEELRSAVGA